MLIGTATPYVGNIDNIKIEESIKLNDARIFQIAPIINKYL
jgi:ribonuclease HIII